MRPEGKVRVGVLGAGAWARFAHLPGYKRDPRCELVAIADPVVERAREFAAEFDIPHVYDSHEALIARDDLHLIDVCTPSATHFELSWAALECGQTRPVREAGGVRFPRDDAAPPSWRAPRGSRRSSASRFATAPAMRYIRKLIDDGFVGHAVHLQRLRAELAVARSDEPAAAGRS
jgi:predicted dehydrogenase